MMSTDDMAGQVRKSLSAGPLQLVLALMLGFPGLVAASGTNDSPSVPEPVPPTTPRQFFNFGTQKLRTGKLREAEAFLESALSSQQAHLQPPALYNLGHVRFGQGLDELQKSPPAAPSAARAKAAAQQDAEASQFADEALGGADVEKLVAAYLRGRGARKESKAAAKAVRLALAAHGAALGKWERASGDFRSALELKTSDADARYNADILDRHIAALVDSLRELQQAANALGDKNSELGEKLKLLKGRIPEPDMPPGAAGDDDEDEDSPSGPKPGDKEAPSKEGQEMTLSPEQAGWLLDGFRLDGERRLPMGQGTTGEPKDRPRRPW